MYRISSDYQIFYFYDVETARKYRLYLFGLIVLIEQGWENLFVIFPIFAGKSSQMKNKILFVCHGNICRSPMAEFVMKHLVEEKGLQDQFEIASAATSTEEIGNPVYPPARRKLAEHGIGCQGKTARQMTMDDYRYYDHVIVMDRNNIRNLHRLLGGDPDHKINLLMNYTHRPGQVADPGYTGDFEATWIDVLEGCEGLLESIMKGMPK